MSFFTPLTSKLTLSLFAASFALSGAAHADDAVSRHTFRSVRAGTADQLAQPRAVAAQDVRVVYAPPLRGDAQRVTSSTGSTSTSDLLGAARVASAPLRSAIALVDPASATAGIAGQAARQSVAAEDQAPVQDARVAVDNNARLAGNYTSYQPATVSYQDAQLALAAHRVQTVGYGNTYGTYSPASYHGRMSYSYAPRTYYSSTYYRPTTHYGYTAYSTPVYYSSSYYSPTYYRPSYSYCPPTYHRPIYRHSYGYHGHYHRPRYSFGYSHGYGRHHGSSWGFSIRW